jgi:hypothetical protein
MHEKKIDLPGFDPMTPCVWILKLPQGCSSLWRVFIDLKASRPRDLNSLKLELSKEDKWRNFLLIIQNL